MYNLLRCKFIIFILLLTLRTHSMDQQDQKPISFVFPPLSNNDLFLKLIVGYLEPRDINSLRKTNMSLSKLFSFHKPSIEFLSCKNSKIHQKDFNSLFITGVYDRNHDLVQQLVFNEKIPQGCFYQISGITSDYDLLTENIALCPLRMAEKHKDQAMYAFLQNKGWQQSKSTAVTYVVSPCPLLIACIARDRDRIRGKIALKLDAEHQQPWFLYVLIDNNDKETLEEIIQKNFEYIKRQGSELIEYACKARKNEIVEMLIDKQCYNDLNEIRWVMDYYMRTEARNAIRSSKTI